MPIYISKKNGLWREITLMYLRQMGLSLEKFLEGFTPRGDCRKIRHLEKLRLAIKIGKAYVVPFSILRVPYIDEEMLKRCAVLVSDELFMILRER